jgi:Fis family transcriptional regulator
MSTQAFYKTNEATSEVTQTQTAVRDVVNPASLINAEVNTTSKPLKECVFSAMKNYYTHIEGSEPSEVYDMLLSQIEPALLETTMEFTRGNQSKAAIMLGLSRGTLRKKLKRYGLD